MAKMFLPYILQGNWINRKPCFAVKNNNRIMGKLKKAFQGYDFAGKNSSDKANVIPNII